MMMLKSTIVFVGVLSSGTQAKSTPRSVMRRLAQCEQAGSACRRFPASGRRRLLNKFLEQELEEQRANFYKAKKIITIFDIGIKYKQMTERKEFSGLQDEVCKVIDDLQEKTIDKMTQDATAGEKHELTSMRNDYYKVFADAKDTIFKIASSLLAKINLPNTKHDRNGGDPIIYELFPHWLDDTCALIGELYSKFSCAMKVYANIPSTVPHKKSSKASASNIKCDVYQLTKKGQEKLPSYIEYLKQEYVNKDYKDSRTGKMGLGSEEGYEYMRNQLKSLFEGKDGNQMTVERIVDNTSGKATWGVFMIAPKAYKKQWWLGYVYGWSVGGFSSGVNQETFTKLEAWHSKENTLISINQ